MKGIKKIESCIKTVNYGIAALERDVDDHKKRVQGHLDTMRTIVKDLTEALAEAEAVVSKGVAQEAMEDVLRTFVQEVFRPTPKLKLAEKPDGMINALYAYCQGNDIELTIPPSRLRATVLTTLREVYASTQVTYSPEYTVRRLLVDPHIMFEQSEYTDLEDLLNDRGFDWYAASVGCPWWQVKGSERIVIQGREYALK